MGKNNTCLFCGAPATLLCDGHLGYPDATAKEQHRAFKGLDLFRPYTCDAPMCEACAQRSASYIVCRRGKGCIPDTVDYCPGCMAARAEEDKTQPNRRRIASSEQANQIRAAHWRTWQKGELVEAVQGGGQISLF
ncbi:hypothetical protein QMM96_22415 [Citrobacter freundii]|uniref:hypothetical protein n=1 Tax=Citrobacter freundii TaxID=546 RepID=UPI002B243101|nr:hypothetical protein [Citrobacter freundii]MEB2478187.1 hypothetical protein [Citrobacter freundii]